MIVTEKDSEAFLEEHKFPVIKRVFCKNLKECEKAARKIRYPVAMKISSSKISHKSDVGGVILNLGTLGDVKKALGKMKRIKGFEGVLLQKYITGDYLLLGVKKDSVFGHTLAIGAGGIYTEVFKDVSFRVCPINNKDAEEMIKELKVYPIIKGIRGQKNMVGKVKEVLIKLSKLVEKYPMITELDINPLILHGKEVTVVDARIAVDSENLA